MPCPHSPNPGRTGALVALALGVLACGGGGGDDGGGTGPAVVATVQITAPAAPPTFQTLTRTAQFTAVARDAAGATMASAPITWSSSNPSVATVNGSGLVTAAGNGTTQVTASSGSVSSSAVTVTVSQVVAGVSVTPAAVAFGAIGSTRQLSAAAVDSSGAPVTGAGAATWALAGTGASASLSLSGLVAALAVGAGDTAVATIGGRSAKAPISVTQVVASVLVSSTGTDTLRTTGRTKQYTAIARDSNTNNIPGLALTWSSATPAVATVDGNGLATAVADGAANVTATASTVSGFRPLVVRRFASTFGLNPTTATITTPNGTQIFLGSAQDSVSTNLPITWTTRTAGIVTLSASTGPQVTATGVGNGVTRLVMSAGTRSDSAQLTVSGQSTAPLTATVQVGNTFFRSQRNNSQNDAVDTVAVGGTVTWQWQAGIHSVASTGAPSFPSSGTQNSGTYVFTFASAGTYTYECAVHGILMTGRVIVQ